MIINNVPRDVKTLNNSMDLISKKKKAIKNQKEKEEKEEDEL